MNALNIQKNQHPPSIGSKPALQITINKLSYNLRLQYKVDQKSKPKKDVFFPYYL